MARKSIGKLISMARPGLIHLLNYRDSWTWENTRSYDRKEIMKYERVYWNRCLPVIRSGKMSLFRRDRIPAFGLELNKEKIFVRCFLCDEYLVAHGEYRLWANTVDMMTYIYNQVQRWLA